jgi:histidine phosphotransfer protein HptB
MTAATIDSATFEALQKTTGADFTRELVDTFLEEAPTMLADLRSALTAQDAVRFRRAAHSLKSNCNTFGALPLAAMARELELSGLPGGGDGAQSLAALDAEYSRVAVALQGMRGA